MEKVVGRDPACDVVIIDPAKRVSRRHLKIEKAGTNLEVMDLGSANGTYINGQKLRANSVVILRQGDRITLGLELPFDYQQITWDEEDLEATRILVQAKEEGKRRTTSDTSPSGEGRKNQAILVDAERTSIGDFLSLSDTGFVSIGRIPGNTVVLDNPKVSREHCKARLVSPVLFEIVDLQSTNGTFVDSKKLEPHKAYLFSSLASVNIGGVLPLNLSNILPGIQLPEVRTPPKSHQASTPTTQPPSQQASPAEADKFLELEQVWKEYTQRQRKATDSSVHYALGGMLAGSIAGLALGPIGALVGIGGQLLGRYIGQQKSNELRFDLTYEDAFLQVYACPRCGESFQKKPWITIRECAKCKTKYR